MANRRGKSESNGHILFSWAPKSLLTVTAAMKLKDSCSLTGKLWQNKTLNSVLNIRDITLPAKVSGQSYGFYNSHVWMWELDCKESRVLKNWCFWTVVLEKTLESSLDCKEIQPVHPKRNQPWISAEVLLVKFQYLDYLMWRANSLEKTLMIGKIEDKGEGGSQE